MLLGIIKYSFLAVSILIQKVFYLSPPLSYNYSCFWRDLDMAKHLKDFLFLTLGTLVVAVGVYFFKFPNNFCTGGVSGISVILGGNIPLPLRRKLCSYNQHGASYRRLYLYRPRVRVQNSILQYASFGNCISS